MRPFCNCLDKNWGKMQRTGLSFVIRIRRQSSSRQRGHSGWGCPVSEDNQPENPYCSYPAEPHGLSTGRDWQCIAKGVGDRIPFQATQPRECSSQRIYSKESEEWLWSTWSPKHRRDGGCRTGDGESRASVYSPHLQKSFPHDDVVWWRNLYIR